MFPSTLPLPRLTAASQVPQLRWGIIGPGWIADHFADALRKHTHQQITAVAARDPAKAQAFADKWSISYATGSIDVLLAREDVDAVYIATPHNHHFPDGLRAIAAGKHLLIEKPLALNAQQATQLKQAAATANRLCMEAMWCNFIPKYDVIRQLLEDGVLGDVHTLIADHGEFSHQTTAFLMPIWRAVRCWIWAAIWWRLACLLAAMRLTQLSPGASLSRMGV